MLDPLTENDEATLYVLGLLSRPERREFERRLHNSRDLRASVRALEAGALALAEASPIRQPPADLWNGIHKAIAQENHSNLVTLFRTSWVRSVLTAAACVVLGWSLHWFSVQPSPLRAARPGANLPEPAGTDSGHGAPRVVDSHRSVPAVDNSSNALRLPRAAPLAPAPIDAVALHRRIADLESQVTSLTQALTQRQTGPADLSRLSFLNLAPAATTGLAAKAAAPSPELQRALLVALARELGWLAPAPAHAEGHEQSLEVPAASLPAHDAEVEFVDLTPSGGEPRRPASGREEQPGPEVSADNQSAQGTIPAFAGASSLTFAVNSTTALGLESITVWSAAGNGQPVSLGNVAVGASPTVVTVPFGMVPNGMHVTITAGSTVIGSFSSTASAVP